MAMGSWDIQPALASLPDLGQTTPGTLSHTGRPWLTVLSLSVVFLIAVFTMMIVGGASWDSFHVYVAIGLAILAPYLWWVHVLEKFDPWTPRAPALIVLAILWGCLPAVVASVTMETVLDNGADSLGQGQLGMMLIAPFSEELTKGLFVVLVFVFARHQLRGPFDGLVIGALVGAGFGFAEDVGYLVDAFVSDGMTGLVANYVLREVFTAHAHLLFTACTGFAAGYAARSGFATGKGLAVIGLGFLVALALHSAWDTSTEFLPSDSDATLIAPVIQGVIAGVIAIAGLRALRHREDRMLGEALSGYLDAGWIDGQDLSQVADRSQRKSAVAHARKLPAPSRGAVRTFYAAVTLLGLNRIRTPIGGDATRSRDEETRILSLLTAARASMSKAVR